MTDPRKFTWEEGDIVILPPKKGSTRERPEVVTPGKLYGEDLDD